MADVPVNAAAHAGNWKAWSGPALFYISDTVGYHFFINSLVDLVYSKTTDGGASWGANVTIKTGTISCAAAYWEKQTPGDNGTLIHLTYLDTVTDDCFHRTLDTSSDTLGTERVAFAGVTFAGLITGTWDARCVSITKAVGGNLYIRSNPDSDIESFFVRSVDGGVNWTSRSIAAMAANNGEVFQLLPANTSDPQDIVTIARTTLFSGAPILRVYDNSADSWAATTGLTTGTPSTSYNMMCASLKRSTNKIYLAYQNDIDASTTDTLVYEIGADAVGAGGCTVTARTNVTTDTSEVVQCGVCINDNTGDVYVAYLAGGTWATSADVWTKKSTDSGVTWGTAVQHDTTTRDYRAIWMPPIIVGSGRVQPSFQDDDTDDIYTNSINGIVITAAVPASLVWQPPPMLALVGR